MSIHGVRSSSAAPIPSAQPAKTAPKSTAASSFEALFGNLTANTNSKAKSGATASNPSSILAGEVVSSRFVPKSATPTTLPAGNPVAAKTPSPVAADTPPPFTATYEQGATVKGLDGSVESLNPMEYATAPTAAAVAQLLGGNEVDIQMSGVYNGSVPMREISVPGSNVQVNAGLAAGLFAAYGTGAGSQAWTQLSQDLGINVGPAGTAG